jgi:hypothetical protein
MDQSFLDGFRSSKGLFKRQEENLLMLEQYLAEIEARYVRLSAASQPGDQPILAEAGKVVDAYRAYRAGRTDGTPRPLPDWNEAFLADQLLTGLLRGEEARAELAAKLSALKGADPATYDHLSEEWDAVKGDPARADAAVPGLAVGALRATQWKNTQRWIVRTLGTRYAARLRNAFLLALALGFALVLVDARLGPEMHSASLSGLGFAIAAGLLGASFSAMVGQQRVFALDNIEEARAATSTQMLALRLGVGVAAAMIVYFFFESGLVDGALFPDLAQIGFERVTPLVAGDEALRANAQAVERSAQETLAALDLARDRIGELLATMSPGEAGAGKAEEILAAASQTMPDSASVLARVGLAEKLQTTTADLAGTRSALEHIQSQWSSGNPALGNLAPNADLSKLVVWCFAAGFTQTLVPSLLARVTPPPEKQA